ncbi:MAG: hypothetical protein HOC97_07385 [Lentimicrobiaceae bacterium]|jgi:hypothetical protein|nr:hypothetical protein [Lentimicrobiaceae bacterium]MBT5669408.1 hypothetical protein [Lentimicrobiaceae bacterium]
MEIFTIILVTIPVILAIYGVIRKQRNFVLWGYFIYGVIVLLAESNSYRLNHDFSHIYIAALYGVQAIIAFPNKMSYTGSKTMKSLAIKNWLSLMLINVIGIYVVNNNDMLPELFAYYHAILAIIPLIGMYFMATNKIPIEENN